MEVNQRRQFLKIAAAAAAPVAALGAQNAAGNVKDLTGGWVTYHDSPFGPFKELLTFGEGGSLTETNVLLHASSNLNLSQIGLPSSLNASDGIGTWVRDGSKRAYVEFRKLLFAVNQGYFGDFWVKGTVEVNGDNLVAHWSQIWIVDTHDKLVADLIAVFGPAGSAGTRIG